MINSMEKKLREEAGKKVRQTLQNFQASQAMYYACVTQHMEPSLKRGPFFLPSKVG